MPFLRNILITLMVVAITSVVDSRALEADSAPVYRAGDIMEVRIIRAIDGDSIVIEAHGMRTTVRLLGIDCPEYKESGGPEAYEFTREWLNEVNGHVRLEMEAQRFDRYDRLLAYVWKGSRMLNEDLLVAGHARIRWLKPGYIHHDRLVRAGRQGEHS